MEISTFILISVIGNNPINWKFKALVDVTTKKGLFRKKVTDVREIFKSYAGAWYFIDTGEYTPGYHVENLVRKLEAEKGKDLPYCLDTKGE